MSPLLVDASVPEEVRAEVVPTSEDGALLWVLVEIDLRAATTPTEALARFEELYRATFGSDAETPVPVAPPYVRCRLSHDGIGALMAADRDAATRGRVVFRIWPDYVMRPLIDRSVRTVKADAARRTYAADGRGVVWAVLDTGVDAAHPHLAAAVTDPGVADLHRDFTWLVRGDAPPDATTSDDAKDALTDPHGHGSHVAGIIAGRLPTDRRPLIATLQSSDDQQDALPSWEGRALEPDTDLCGVAPRAGIVSLRVLDTGAGEPTTTSSAVIAALRHVHEVNAYGRRLRIHGVNLSLGCPWFYRDYAAGQSPLCREVDLLVGSGVVVVVSAGNGGYSAGTAPGEGGGAHGVLSTITDPGNAERAITVGCTHRDRPHVYGVTYVSSKGPTLDGRPKPDLVAPGERITSCATGRLRDRIPALAEAPSDAVCYAEDTGTSMAAPHVSGAVACFLSVRPEFIGRPDDVKRLFCAGAMPLGRDRNFEGHGLVDLMKTLSGV